MKVGFWTAASAAAVLCLMLGAARIEVELLRAEAQWLHERVNERNRLLNECHGDAE